MREVTTYEFDLGGYTYVVDFVENSYESDSGIVSIRMKPESYAREQQVRLDGIGVKGSDIPDLIEVLTKFIPRAAAIKLSREHAVNQKIAQEQTWQAKSSIAQLAKTPTPTAMADAAARTAGLLQPTKHRPMDTY